VIDDSDSDPESEVIALSQPPVSSSATSLSSKAVVQLPGPGQRGQLPALPTARSDGGSAQLSERAKAKSRALDPPHSVAGAATSLQPPRPAPYQAYPDATPILLPLLCTYNCPICLCPPVDLVTTPCGHLFCGSCLFDTLLTQTKKAQEEEQERRIFIANTLQGIPLPQFLPAALTEAHLGAHSGRPAALDARARASLRATAFTNAAVPTGSGSSNGAGSSRSTSSSIQSSSSGAASSASASASGTGNADRGTAAARGTDQSSFINGARAAAQNALDRLRPLAMAVFHPDSMDSHSSLPGEELPSSSQGSAGRDSAASPPPSSAASSSSGSSIHPRFRLSRAHPGMSSLSSRSASPNQNSRGLHNLAGICPICRGQIPKGFNVNKRSRPEASRYIHTRDGRPRRSVKNIDPTRGKVLGLRLTLGRPADDPFSVAAARRKRTLDEIESDHDDCFQVAPTASPLSSLT